MTNDIRIGLDFGGVIVKPETAWLGEDTGEPARWEPQEGAFECVASLVRQFGGAVFIVSKAGPRMQERTMEWFELVRFYDRTGVCRENVFFCRERREKLTHCEGLSITHFVDDRIKVLQILHPAVPHLFWFAPEHERPYAPEFAIRVSRWNELVELLLASTT